MSSFPVKWYDYRFHGIPALNGTPGSMVAILDAVLVNGFGDTNVASITVKDKKAKLILVDGVRFFKKSVVSISGLNDQRFNTEYRVLESDLGTLTIELDTPDGPLDEGNVNIVVKYAPLGWFKPFSNVSKAVYRPSALDARNWYFVVDDTGAQVSKVNICEDATSTENIMMEAPFRSSYYWKKSPFANATSCHYSIIGDPYCLYFKSNTTHNGQSTYIYSNINLGLLYFVGEPITIGDAPDPFNVLLVGALDTATPGTYYDLFSENNGVSLRDFNGFKTTNLTLRTFHFSGFKWGSFNSDSNFMFNNKYNLLSNANYFHSSDRRVSMIPGIYIPNSYKYFDNFDYFLEKNSNEFKRDFIMMRSGQHSSEYRTIYFDIDGPWR